jgi:hypothetical protein
MYKIGINIGKSSDQMFSGSTMPGVSVKNALQLNRVVIFTKSSKPGTLLIREPVIRVPSNTAIEIDLEGMALTLFISCMASYEGLALSRKKNYYL